ncbi:MAG: outer membrane protein transport protein [Bacteroidia bacterium]|nr:outer membrane protein transport protein [Bacteroidia bacterium]MCX7651620.1 outer membrane protein transport protein [Bacteroidia bacterium]MDW8417295.1 outer membrane protein transport protein [Bacteroidia bacterium]
MRMLWALLGAGSLLAQTELDAERWSQSIPQGSARALGMGGAFTALGGDPSNLTQNPAGIGLFMRGGLWLTPTLSVSTTSSSYLGPAQDSRSHLGLSQFAAIFHVKGGRTITHWNFGVGYNQEGFFVQNTLAQGFNTRNSITQAFAEQAEGIPDTLLFGSPALAYNTFVQSPTPSTTWGVIDLVSTNPWRYKGVFSDGGIFQDISRQEKGRLNTWGVSVGLCYQNMVFFGASLLIRSLNYSNLYRFREIDTENRYNGQNGTSPVDQIVLREKYTSSGSGFGLAVGVLVEPLDYFRFGASFITGSRINIQDEYTADMELLVDDGRSALSSFEEPYQYEYTFSYPYRVNAGLAFIIPERGAVSVEGEYLDYRTAGFTSEGYSYDIQNENIERSFGGAYNLRVGTEWLLSPQVSIRGGYAYYSPVRNPQARQYYADPLRPQNLTTLAMQRQFISLGASYSFGSFFVDMAYIYAMSAQVYLAYYVRNPAYAPAPNVVIQDRTHRVVTTFGLRF